MRESILSCRAWLKDTDAIEQVYQYYDVLERMVQAMDNIQNFVQIKSSDTLEIFQAKLQLKTDEWFGSLEFPVDPLADRDKFVCKSECP